MVSFYNNCISYQQELAYKHIMIHQENVNALIYFSIVPLINCKFSVCVRKIQCKTGSI